MELKKGLCIQEKVCVIRSCESEHNISDMWDEFGLVNLTVGAILKNKDTILKVFEEDGDFFKIRNVNILTLMLYF